MISHVRDSQVARGYEVVRPRGVLPGSDARHTIRHLLRYDEPVQRAARTSRLGDCRPLGQNNNEGLLSRWIIRQWLGVLAWRGDDVSVASGVDTHIM